MSAPSLGQINRYIPFSLVDGPGNRFVLFVQGCNFNCIACHNPQTIGNHPELGSVITVEEVIDLLKVDVDFISGITVSGGEATQQSEFVGDLFGTIKQTPRLRHLTTFIDSNGSASRSVWEMLAPVTDGAMIDLKAFDPTVHLELSGQENSQVLDSISFLYEVGLLYEVRLLIVPGFNDSREAIERTAKWLDATVPDVRIKVIGFRSHGTRPIAAKIPEASPDELLRIKNQLSEAGLNEVRVI